jgi:heterodisulfide reductase subunit B
MINEKFGTDFNYPVMFYSQLMAVAFGLDAEKDAALHQHLIPPQAVIARAK